MIYANDPMAIAGLGVLHARGIGVPDDVSVVGFDGIELGRHVFPALTTVEADPEAWGAAAAATLLALIADGQAADVELRPARLLLRDSTAPPPVSDAQPTEAAAPSSVASPVNNTPSRIPLPTSQES